MRHLIFTVCILLKLTGGFSADFQLPQNVRYLEVEQYPDSLLATQKDGMGQQIVLHFDYAKPIIRNPEAFSLQSGEVVTSVRLVFTKYPVDYSRWRTDYDSLLVARLKALYQLDSAIFSSPQVKWTCVLQTACTSEPEAMRFFHGLIIKTHAGPSEKVDSLTTEFPEMLPLADIIYGRTHKLADSSIYKILDRHPEWEDKLVVMDWTSSMYRNGASVMNWHRKHLSDSSIRHLVLFNDGNQTPHALKKIGRTGGIYYSSPDNLEEVMQTMLQVKKGGLGGDPAENDIEALLKGTKGLKGYETVVLIPDRKSSIRDLRLVRHVNQPVRILLFANKKSRTVGLGATGEWKENYWIHPHYLTLASLTKGSVHTLQQDIYGLADMKAGEIFQIGDRKYQKQESGAFKTVRE